MKFQLFLSLFLFLASSSVVSSQFDDCLPDMCSDEGPDIQPYLDLLYELENNINFTLSLPDSSWWMVKFYNGNISRDEFDYECACPLRKQDDQVFITFHLQNLLDIWYNWEVGSSTFKLQGTIQITSCIDDLRIHLLESSYGGYKIKEVEVETQRIFSVFIYGAFSDYFDKLPPEYYEMIVEASSVPAKEIIEETYFKAFSQLLKKG
ncbi:hypothetical protein X975_00905, partial [Stegodyphus mimosarum]